MAALHDGQLVALIHSGAAVVVFCCHLSQSGQHVQLCHGVGCTLDAVELGTNAFQQLIEQPVFQSDQPLVGTQDLIFQFLELLCDVAFAGGQGLLADVALRHLCLIRVADLDEIAKHVVIADLQLGDAGLQLSQHALGVIADGTQLVHLGVVALGNDTTILQGRRCVRVHSGIDLVLDIAQRVDPGDDFAEFGAAAAFGLLAQAGQALTGLCHGIDFFGRG